MTDNITNAIAARAKGKFPPEDVARLFQDKASALMRKAARDALDKGTAESDVIKLVNDWQVPPPGTRKLSEAEKMHRKFDKLSAADQAEFRKALGL
ncbi:MAG: hypothetical protein ACR2P5_04670 [Gammaproteobacteria bacterium]